MGRAGLPGGVVNLAQFVNPTSPWDGSGVTRTIELGGTNYIAETSGGGVVPPSGVEDATVTYRAVTAVTLGPYSAAVLLDAPG